jgi:hypothetical protein
MAFVRLLAILLSSIIVGLSLPHVANVRFKAMISLGPAPVLDRLLPYAGAMALTDSCRPTRAGRECRLSGILVPI